MASIRPYTGGRWRAQVRKVGFSTRSEIFDTKKVAEAWARKVETQMAEHNYKDPSKFAKETVGALFEKFRDEVSPTRKGGRWETVRINMLLADAEFMKRRITELRPKDIRAWRDQRVTEVKPVSVIRELGLISGVFSHAIEEWDYPFPFNPCHEVSRPKVTGATSRNRRWADHEIQALCEACNYDPNTPPKRGTDFVPWGLLLMIETAMRPSEFCSVPVKNVHLDQRFVHLVDSKNGDTRDVPLSSKAIELLTVLTRDRKPDQPVFPMTSQSLGVRYRDARKLAKLDANLRFYDGKHEGISRMAPKFRDAVELSKVTGHRDLKSLAVYYNPKVAELADKLG